MNDEWRDGKNVGNGRLQHNPETGTLKRVKETTHPGSSEGCLVATIVYFGKVFLYIDAFSYYL